MNIYPNSFALARCRGCGREIIWALTYPNRAKAPLDRPVSYRSNGTDADGHAIAELQSKAHFDTCPKADKFRSATPTPKPIEQPRLF